MSETTKNIRKLKTQIEDFNNLPEDSATLREKYIQSIVLLAINLDIVSPRNDYSAFTNAVLELIRKDEELTDIAYENTQNSLNIFGQRINQD